MLRRNLKNGTDFTRNVKKKSAKKGTNYTINAKKKSEKKSWITQEMPCYCILLTKVRFSPRERERR